MKFFRFEKCEKIRTHRSRKCCRLFLNAQRKIVGGGLHEKTQSKKPPKPKICWEKKIREIIRPKNQNKKIREIPYFSDLTGVLLIAWYDNAQPNHHHCCVDRKNNSLFSCTSLYYDYTAGQCFLKSFCCFGKLVQPGCVRGAKGHRTTQENRDNNNIIIMGTAMGTTCNISHTPSYTLWLPLARSLHLLLLQRYLYSKLAGYSHGSGIPW